ncbi:MAG: rRNA maturation RNase YbeY [Chloroflexota bacterium]|jgi:rRNA maturation RNase YbeY
MINLQIDLPYQNLLDEKPIFACASEVIRLERPENHIELTLVITNDVTLTELNSRHLGIDAPTDVLAFPADEFDPDEQLTYIGDVILSYPRAHAQAELAGHPVQNEICLLVVHGVLHLLGYDHFSAAEKAVMWQKQADILASLNIEIKQLPE